MDRDKFNKLVFWFSQLLEIEDDSSTQSLIGDQIVSMENFFKNNDSEISVLLVYKKGLDVLPISFFEGDILKFAELEKFPIAHKLTNDGCVMFAVKTSDLETSMTLPENYGMGWFLYLDSMRILSIFPPARFSIPKNDNKFLSLMQSDIQSQ